jgi:hypothetical protein
LIYVQPKSRIFRAGCVEPLTWIKRRVANGAPDRHEPGAPR